LRRRRYDSGETGLQGRNRFGETYKDSLWCGGRQKKEKNDLDRAQRFQIWRHSGFSVDASVHIPAGSSKTREALSQYIARPPLSLQKINIEENGEATVISYTSHNDFFKRKIESFSVTRFLLELTQHSPPRGVQYIRRYGLYASRSKGKWPDMPHVMRLAPAGWKAEGLKASESIQSSYEKAAVPDQESSRTCRSCLLG